MKVQGLCAAEARGAAAAAAKEAVVAAEVPYSVVGVVHVFVETKEEPAANVVVKCQVSA